MPVYIAGVTNTAKNTIFTISVIPYFCVVPGFGSAGAGGNLLDMHRCGILTKVTQLGCPCFTSGCVRVCAVCWHSPEQQKLTVVHTGEIREIRIFSDLDRLNLQIKNDESTKMTGLTCYVSYLAIMSFLGRLRAPVHISRAYNIAKVTVRYLIFPLCSVPGGSAETQVGSLTTFGGESRFTYFVCAVHAFL